MLDLLQVVRRDVAEIVEPVRVRIARGHREHLLVGRAAIHEVEEPDRARVHQAAGEDRDGHQHEHVERIAVVAEGAREEAVVARIVHGAVQHAVETEDAELLVELVLVALVGGDLDDGGDFVGGFGPVGMSCHGWKLRWGMFGTAERASACR